MPTVTITPADSPQLLMTTCPPPVSCPAPLRSRHARRAPPSPALSTASSSSSSKRSRSRSPSARLSPKRPRRCSPPPAPHPGPGPPPLPPCLPSSVSLSSCSSLVSFAPPARPSPARDLPDEVLVSILRFVDSASKLAGLRLVSHQWRRVIDATPYVWRLVSFKNSSFAPRVRRSPTGLLGLSPRPGEAAVTLAARSGNEWGRFLKRTVFDRHTLHAVTAPQPVASLLVAGARTLDARPFPPWLGDHPPEHDGAWIAVHAGRRPLDLDSGVARADTAAAAQMLRDVHEGVGDGRGGELERLPRGAMVGLIHVREAFKMQAGVGADSAGWIWRIDRAVSLKRPIKCAGFVGLWAISGCLTDLLVNAMHRQ